MDDDIIFFSQALEFTNLGPRLLISSSLSISEGFSSKIHDDPEVGYPKWLEKGLAGRGSPYL